MECIWLHLVILDHLAHTPNITYSLFPYSVIFPSNHLLQNHVQKATLHDKKLNFKNTYIFAPFTGPIMYAMQK